MPINRQLIAKTSGFQHNCALNCFVHKLCPSIARNKVSDEALRVFREQFNRYYNVTLNANEFRTAISNITNPYHREIILAPVLRTMLLMPEVTDPYDFNAIRAEEEAAVRAFQPLRPEINTPGEDLDDIEIMPLANFFGIRVEIYSPRLFRERVHTRCHAESRRFRGRRLSDEEMKTLDDGIAALWEPNPDFSALTDTILSFASNIPPAYRGLARNQIMNDLRQYYGEVPNWDCIRNASPAMFAAQNRVLARVERDPRVGGAGSPVLKLWNRSGVHWEYEEENQASKTAHDQYYPHVNPNLYLYGTLSRQGDPDAQAVRARIRQALNPAAGEKNLRLTELLRGYEREQAAAFRPLAQASSNPNASNFNAYNADRNNNNNNNNANNNDAAFNPFASFGNLFSGGLSGLSEIGQKIVAAFIEPFKEDMAQKPANDDGKPKSLMDTVAGAIISFHSIIMKLASAFVNLKPIMDEFQTSANRKNNPSADLQTSELGKHPEALVFAEYVKLLPLEVKARLNALWLDKKIAKSHVMEKLHEALKEAVSSDDIELFNFKRNLLKLSSNNSALRRHLLDRWRDEVYAKRLVTSDEDKKIRDDRKQEILVELETALKNQGPTTNTLGEAFAKAAKAAGTQHKSDIRDVRGLDIRGLGEPKELGNVGEPSRNISGPNNRPDSNRPRRRSLESEDPKVLAEMQKIRANAQNAGIPIHHPNANRVNPAGIPSFTPAFRAAMGGGVAAAGGDAGGGVAAPEIQRGNGNQKQRRRFAADV